MNSKVNKIKLKKKNRSNKVSLVFDENKRREFLTGFHKRKLQRKKKAQDELQQQLKEERRRLKTEAKESYKKMVVSHRPVPEIEHLLQDNYEDDEVSVRVVELSTNEISKQNNWIGANYPVYEEEADGPDKDVEDKSPEIPGMELTKRSNSSAKKEDTPIFKEEKDLKRALKKQATKNVKNSKIFQMKNKIESQKQKKKSRRLKCERMKVYDKQNKHKKTNTARNR